MYEYYTKSGSLDPKWVDGEASKAAQFFYPGEKLKSTQLLKFYGDVKTLERRWVAGGYSEESFLGILPLIKLLKAKVKYAQARTVVPPFFSDWLCSHVDSIQSGKDFKAFLLHFEAVVGFSYDCASKDF